jgi:hypothetical protein
MGWFRRLFQGRAEKKGAGVVFDISENGGSFSNVAGQDLILEREVRALEASLEQRQEEAPEEEVAGVEKAIEGDESGQAEADESEVSKVEREVEDP